VSNKKKSIHSDNLKNDLSGFEEVIDYLIEDKRKGDRDKINLGANPFDLFNFLEREKTRLEKIDILFRNKVPNLENNPIPLKLCEIQKERLEISRNELVKKLSDRNSPLYKNLNDLFDKAYS
jgi:site-specific recombinase